MDKKLFLLLAAVFVSIWIFLDYLKAHGWLALLLGMSGMVAMLLYYEFRK